MKGPLDIYKMLPRTNCSHCPQGTCMAYAAAFLKGEVTVDDCPFLSEETKRELMEVTPKDWRQELIEKLKEEINAINLNEIAPSIGAVIINDSICIRCLGSDYFINHDGEIKTEGYINPWIQILLLHYVRTSGRGRPTGEWVSFSELKSGMVKALSFNRDCEEPLKELFERDTATVESVFTTMGAQRISFESADYAYIFYPLPRIPSLIIYRKGINSSLRILFDRITDRFLDVESIIFLFEGLVHLIRSSLSHHRG